MEVSIPSDLCEAMTRYLSHHRTILAGDRYIGDSLWVSFHYKAEGPRAVHIQITQYTRGAFGKPVNPYLFRDCAATSIAINNPANIGIASAVLGHGTFAAVEKSYNLARSIDASRTYSRTIEALRQLSPRTNRSSRRPKLSPNPAGHR
jgi:site-specific recombinase XerD